MFEQSILLPDPDKKRWTFAASIVVEVAAVSVLLLIPLVYTEKIGLGWIQSSVLHTPTPPPPTMPQVEPQVPSHRTTATRAFNPFEAPRTIPKGIRMVNDDPPSDYSNVIGDPILTIGVAHSIGIGGTEVPPLPKPQPKPVEPKKIDPAPPAEPVKVSQGTQEAKIIRRVIPTYPALARQARVQGTVKLVGVISTDGRIEKLQVLSGNPLLVPAAVEAVKQWTYRPTLLNGQPVEVMAPIDVNFVLSN